MMKALGFLKKEDVPALETRQRTDAQVIGHWVHGKSPHTQAAYQRDVKRLFAHTGKTLVELTLADLQDFDDWLQHERYADTSRERTLAACKSLLAFAQKTGYLALNVGMALTLPKHKDKLAERILPEGAVLRLIDAEPEPRNRIILNLLYRTAIRRAELVRLCWGDVQERPDLQAGQIVVFGKGGKTRSIVLQPEDWQELQALRGQAPDEASVFNLEASQIYRIVQQAAKRIGLTKPVSPHWMRHAHASHALNRGAPISLVQATLGHSNVAITGRYTHAQPDQSSGTWLPR